MSAKHLVEADKCSSTGASCAGRGAEVPELDGNHDATVKIWDAFGVSNCSKPDKQSNVTGGLIPVQERNEA